MRRFYEAWTLLDGDNSCAEGNPAVATTEMLPMNSAVTTAELQETENQIDICHAITIPNITEFPVENFFKVPFTHHSRLILLCKEMDARYYYIHRTAEEHLSVEAIEKLIKQKAFENPKKDSKQLC